MVIDGRFEMLMPEDEQVFAYLRDDGRQKLLVACNFSGEEAVLDESARKTGEVLLCNYDEIGAAETLRPWEARIVLI